jgi:hypothetical protein
MNTIVRLPQTPPARPIAPRAASPMPLDILGAGAGGPLPAPSPWTQGSGFVSYAQAVVIGTPTGGALTPGSLNLQSIYLNGVQFLPSNYLPMIGGTLTGPLMLNADPTSAFGASTKGYVDARAWIEAPSDGQRYERGTFGGVAQWIRDPMQGDAPSDGGVYGRGGPVGGPNVWEAIPAVSEAPNDGTTYGVLNGAWSNQFDAGTF